VFLSSPKAGGYHNMLLMLMLLLLLVSIQPEGWWVS
jgi:hypothetical protein